MSRIQEKIEEVEKYLEQISNILPQTYEEYTENFVKRAACERLFEKIIEGVVDLAFLVIRERKLDKPESDTEAFFILSDSNLITKELAEKLKNAKGMRNILAHEYGEVDDDLVFQAISEELEKDISEFIESIKKES